MMLQHFSVEFLEKKNNKIFEEVSNMVRKFCLYSVSSCNLLTKFLDTFFLVKTIFSHVQFVTSVTKRYFKHDI